MPADTFEQVVSLHYTALFRFALGLTRSEPDASDLTQQTFYIWATKSHQLLDQRKVKSWLFTILHREFLSGMRRSVRFPQCELSDTEEELPSISPEAVSTIDGARVLECLEKIPDPYRAALILFYIEDYSYKEICEILEVPIGTVRSRLFRGLAQLQNLMLQEPGLAAREDFAISAPSGWER